MVRNEFFTLNNGVKIPAIGFGTWQVADGEEAYRACLDALEVGYRHIDTAFARSILDTTWTISRGCFAAITDTDSRRKSISGGWMG